VNPVPIVRGRYRRPGGRKDAHGIRGFEERVRRGGKIDRRRLPYREVVQIEDWLTEDRGGPDRINHGERLMIQITAFAFWVCLRARRDALDRGAIDENGELRPSLRKSFISYSNAARRNLELLGIRAEKIEQALATCARCGAGFADLAGYTGHFDQCRRTVTEAQNRPETHADSAVNSSAPTDTNGGES